MTKSDDVDALPEHECWAALRGCEVGRVGICTEEGPLVLPVNYLVDHGTVVFRTGAGSKLAAATERATVAFEVDGYDVAQGTAWSVVVRGRAEMLNTLHTQLEALDLPLFPWHAAPRSAFVRIVPEQVTGRRFTVVGQSSWTTPTTGARRAPSE